MAHSSVEFLRNRIKLVSRFEVSASELGSYRAERSGRPKSHLALVIRRPKLTAKVSIRVYIGNGRHIRRIGQARRLSGHGSETREFSLSTLFANIDLILGIREAVGEEI